MELDFAAIVSNVIVEDVVEFFERVTAGVVKIHVECRVILVNLIRLKRYSNARSSRQSRGLQNVSLKLVEDHAGVVSPHGNKARVNAQVAFIDDLVHDVFCVMLGLAGGLLVLGVEEANARARNMGRSIALNHDDLGALLERLIRG